MGKILKTGIIQQHNVASIDDNRARLAAKIRRLAADGAKLIVNQELHDSLYFCQTENVDLCGLAVNIPSDVTDFYSALAKELDVVIVTSLFERRPRVYTITLQSSLKMMVRLPGNTGRCIFLMIRHIMKNSILPPEI